MHSSTSTGPRSPRCYAVTAFRWWTNPLRYREDMSDVCSSTARERPVVAAGGLAEWCGAGPADLAAVAGGADADAVPAPEFRWHRRQWQTPRLHAGPGHPPPPGRAAGPAANQEPRAGRSQRAAAWD